MINKVSNIDTICVLLDIKDYENESFNVLNYLNTEKEKAKLAVTSNANDKHLITLNEMTFQLFTNGSQGYSYILRNNDYEVKIAQFRSKVKSLYPIQVRFSSECLWSNGVSNAWSIIYNWIVETFGNILDNKVFRLDLATHVSDIDFITDNEISYKGKFKKRDKTFHTGRNINCITFGTRKSKCIYCRIYNKSLEVREKNQKLWFRDIWNENKLNINNVWNVEFEIKSELFRKYNIHTIEDVTTHTKDLWEYCTKTWLIKIDKTNTRIARCRINNNWLELQDSFNHFKAVGLIEKQKQLQYDADALVPSIVGNITSYSARHSINDIGQAFNTLYKETTQYLSNKNTDFRQVVDTKASLLRDSEVN